MYLKLSGIIWYHDIVEKLEWKHNVNKNEVKEIFYYAKHFRFIEKGHSKDENLYSVYGQTENGSYLVVFFIYKRDKQALIISARDMTLSERRVYDKK